MKIVIEKIKVGGGEMAKMFKPKIEVLKSNIGKRTLPKRKGKDRTGIASRTRYEAKK